MSTSPQSGGQRVIYVHLEQEPEVTAEVCVFDNSSLSVTELIVPSQFGLGFCYWYEALLLLVYLTADPKFTALGYLYSSISSSLIQPSNARAVLAAGCLLGGMPDLCNYAYDVCRQSISLENISEWLEFVDAIPSPSDGSSTPVEPHQLPSPRTAVFGPYAERLRDDILNFLVVVLPRSLNVNSVSSPATPQSESQPSDAGRDTLLQVFARVPFDLFKTAIESPLFDIGGVLLFSFSTMKLLAECLVSNSCFSGSHQARFKFAKDATEARKRGIARGQGAEETVVLAFGANNYGGSPVHVTRKMKKRPLWKVGS